MTSALIGYTGFVGQNLSKAHTFDRVYNTKNLEEIWKQRFDLLVCAAPSAEKWKANKEPEKDLASVERLIASLLAVQAERCVLISTVDVYARPIDVDESTSIKTSEIHAYGRHRRQLEETVAANFPSHLILRLPGLFGPGLKKNVIYDLIHDNMVANIDPGASFQFYSVPDLWNDIERATKLGLSLLNVSVAPLQVQTIAESVFGRTLPVKDQAHAEYRMRSLYAEQLGGRDGYMYGADEALSKLRAFVKSQKPAV